MQDFVFEKQLSPGTELGLYAGNRAVLRRPCDGADGLIDRADEVAVFHKCAGIVGIPQLLWHNSSISSRLFSSVSLVRTYIEGHTLAELSQNVSCDSKDSCLCLMGSYAFFDGLRNIVSAIHERGYSGLDIKASNVGVCIDGQPFLFDFGTVFKKPVFGFRKWHHRVYTNLDYVDIDLLQRGEFNNYSCSQLYYMQSNHKF
jgi:serine/threonine protein kinase